MGESTALEQGKLENQSSVEGEEKGQISRPLYVSKSQKVSDEIIAKGFSGGKEDVAEDSKIDIGNMEDGEEVPVIKNEKVEKRKQEIQAEVDRLVAQKKAVEQEILELSRVKEESSNNSSKDVPEPKKYTREQLATAINSFLESSDSDGIMSVFEYMLDERETKYKDIVKYIDDEKKERETVKAVSEEWKGIVKDFSNYSDEFLRSDKDFDITNQSGKLFLLAKNLYEGEETSKKYRFQNGQTQAVKDAYAELLKEKVKAKYSQKKDKESSSIVNQLEKEKRKNSFGDGASNIEEPMSGGLKSDNDKLKEAIEQRNKFRRERMRGTGF